jgi:hypothetical protein
MNNNPVRYNDPTGKMIDQGDDGGYTTGTECEPMPPANPIIWETKDVIVVIMPPGSNPTLPRPEWAQRLGTGMGIAGFIMDFGEMVGIFIPDIGGEDIAGLWDIGITYVSSLSSGQSYLFEKPHPNVPSMIGTNQDVLVTAGDAFIALGAKAVGAVVGGEVGYVVGLGTDMVTTGVSLVYDYNRVYGTMPNYLTLGVSVSPDTFGKGVIIIWPR